MNPSSLTTFLSELAAEGDLRELAPNIPPWTRQRVLSETTEHYAGGIDLIHWEQRAAASGLCLNRLSFARWLYLTCRIGDEL
jgi:hypothetical protein